MQHLYALFIGINRYDGCANLNGCVNDAHSFHQFLKENCDKDKLNLQALILTDEQATRQAIIDAFGHFDAAKADDICLFYYAGHGSQILAPKELQHLEASEWIETIVCHDSRGENGRDLVDKELSYLVWKATHNNKLHFTAIMDCCHAGSGLRSEYIGHRRMSIKSNTSSIQNYLGIEQYKKVEQEGEIHYYPPRGTYIQLAAARNTQTAKELYIDQQYRGNFTYHLIAVLKENNNQISYQDLIQQVAARMALRVKDQHPQIDTTLPNMKKAGFLSAALLSKPLHYHLRLDLKTMDWVLDAGSIQNIRPTGKGEGTILCLEDGQDIKVRAVGPNTAVVSGMDGYNGRKIHKAFIKQLGADSLKIAFAPQTAVAAQTLLLQTAAQHKSELLHLGVPIEDARYWLWVENDVWWLTYPTEKEAPIFPKVKGHDKWTAIDLLQKMDKLAKWIQVLELNNPHTTLRQNVIKIDLFKIIEAGNHEDSAEADLVPQDGSIPFIHGENGEMPAFRLRITNLGLETIWVSALYMDSLLGISNQMLPKQALGAGQEVWMLDVVINTRQQTRYEYKTIPVSIPVPGQTKSKDFIKILASTDEIQTDEFNQKAIELDVESSPHRRAGRRTIVAKPDWMAQLIALNIEK